MSVRGICLVLLALGAGPAFGQADQVLPAIGGPGGGQFFQRCERGDVLTGLRLQVGDDVDGIRAVCASATAPTFAGNRRAFSRGVGGYGGDGLALECPDAAPAINGIEVGYEGEQTLIVNNVHVYCSVALPNQPLTAFPSKVFDGPLIGEVDSGILVGGRMVPLMRATATCPAGLVAVGITGRAGRWLDALGLICGALPYDPNPRPAPPANPPVKSLGRVNTGSSAPRPARSLCDSARDALARSSPAAPNLVAQCQAAGGSATSVARNEDLEAVRLRGEYLCSMDSTLAELRERATGPARRGFEIGIGIWNQDTAPGPGKQRFHDALTRAEQPGFDLAATYALPRNLHAPLIAVGAAIAAHDDDVAVARNGEADAFFRLGFDIASGLFGDPAAGSQGSRAMGSGAMGIRNALNDAGRRGFDTATKLHLARNYP